jgi:hypothetical protein
MVELTPVQRRAMPASATAWASWVAVHQELDEAARDHLAAALPTVLARFDANYDDPDNVQHRAYLPSARRTLGTRKSRHGCGLRSGRAESEEIP